ncbi:MAG: hypothetical protein KF696_11790 [Planctomycetes bacterium]|nr:hypothetical protein [Planctomycetota bacterium]MCW8136970.1 hypothetical protein [Planctomycetota bacterium]
MDSRTLADLHLNRLPEDSGEWHVQPLKFRRPPPPPGRHRCSVGTILGFAVIAVVQHALVCALGWAACIAAGTEIGGWACFPAIAVPFAAALFVGVATVQVMHAKRRVHFDEALLGAVLAALAPPLFFGTITFVVYAADGQLVRGLNAAICCGVFVGVITGMCMPFMIGGAAMMERRLRRA